LIALTLGVEDGDRCPQARDLQHHLRAVVTQELLVAGGLVVVPDVVEDRRVDVTLVAAEVRLPGARQRIEVDLLGLLDPLAAALPMPRRAARTSPRSQCGGPRTWRPSPACR